MAWKSSFRQNYRTTFSPTFPTSAAGISHVVADVEAPGGEKWEYLKSGGKQWQATSKNLPRMQRTRAIPVAWLNSGLCPDRPKGWIPIIIIKHGCGPYVHHFIHWDFILSPRIKFRYDWVFYRMCLKFWENSKRPTDGTKSYLAVLLTIAEMLKLLHKLECGPQRPVTKMSFIWLWTQSGNLRNKDQQNALFFLNLFQ